MGKIAKNKNQILKRLLLFLIPAFLLLVGAHQKAKAQNWAGVDETVVEKFAEEGGRKPWKPFINTDQGDLLLFAFLLAGCAGGFVFGFYWRILFCEKKGKQKSE
ncbi:MAG: hypothetical protein AABY28_01480 [Candidatus Omnitrophota bacterium]